MGWYCGNATKTQLVAQKEPNVWGLYDMHGNVWEWCHDWKSEDYPKGLVIDPIGPKIGSMRVYRCGCWSCQSLHCRSAFRNSSYPNIYGNSCGARIAFFAPEPIML